MGGQCEAAAQVKIGAKVQVAAAAAVQEAQEIARAVAVFQGHHAVGQCSVDFGGVGIGHAASAGGASRAGVVARVEVADQAHVKTQAAGDFAFEAAIQIHLPVAIGGAVELLDPTDVGGPDTRVETALVRKINAALQCTAEVGLCQAAKSIVAHNTHVVTQGVVRLGRFGLSQCGGASQKGGQRQGNLRCGF